MVKHTKKGKNRLDKYYYLAKEQGFRSRAAFKLIQLNRKHNFLSNCRALLDLCAAPGGWMQVAAKSMPLGSLILGVDLMPIKPIRGAKSFISDITTQQCRQLLKREAGGSLFDVVVHDGAPNVGGAWASEAYTQSALVVDALALAVEFLAPGGTFVTKVFRSKDYNALLYAFGQLFNKVDATKPQASRNASAEIFVVCLGYKAPAKVDPRLLDPKVLFQEVAEVPKVMGPEALLKAKIKQKRHREGYEEGLSSSHRALPATAFLLSPTPIEMLGQATQLVISGKAAEAPVAPEGDDEQQQPLQLDFPALAAAIASHSATDSEIKALCSDLQVLGRSEFKALLRWRLALRKDLKPMLGAAGEAEAAKQGSHKKQQQQQQQHGSEGEGEQQQQDAEAKLLAEMEAVKDAAEQRLRRERRKRREAKKKAKLRAAQLLLSQGGDEGVEAAPDGETLFSLGAIDVAGGAAAAVVGSKGATKGSKKGGGVDVLSKLASASAPGAAEMELLEEPDSDGMVSLSDDGSDLSSLDSEEEALDYEAQLEEQLEDAYQQYLHRKGVRDAALKEKRQRLGKGGELGSDDDEGGAAAADGADGSSDDDEDDTEQYAAALQQAADASEDEDAAAAAAAGGGLLVQLEPSRAGVAKGGAAAAVQWFGQDLFGDPNVVVSSEEEEEEQQQQQQQPAKRQRQDAAAAAGAKKQQQQQQQGEAEDDADEEQQQQVGAAAKKKRKGQNGVLAAAAGAANGAAAAAAAGFEEVAASSSDSEGGSSSQGGGGSSSDDSDAEEFDALDDAGKAEVLALAKRMLRRKDKESILEAAYNRYAFHDDKLPRWFAEDERRHMRPIPQVSKAEVEEEKARLAAIDARPIKKVAEAKARKRKRMQVRLDAARAKATSIAAQEDVPMASKMKEIEKIYAKARAMNGPGKKGSKGSGKGGRGDKRKGPALDKRMKKDKRGMKKAEKRAGGRKGGGVKKGGRKGGKR